MSELTVNYTGESVNTAGLVSSPAQAATHMLSGFTPSNLTDLSTNHHFRDVVVGLILRDVKDHTEVLSGLCAALRSTDRESDVRCYSEYVAAIAFSWEHPQVAFAAIARNQPTNASTFIWGVAQAMHKKMPGPFYQTLLLGQLPQSIVAYEASK